ncbi:hypothetical protein, partial [Methanothrix sp.]
HSVRAVDGPGLERSDKYSQIGIAICRHRKPWKPRSLGRGAVTSEHVYVGNSFPCGMAFRIMAFACDVLTPISSSLWLSLKGGSYCVRIADARTKLMKDRRNE